MRILADCGSTSCKWLVEGHAERISGPGMNPAVTSPQEFAKRLDENRALWTDEERQTVSQVDYFGTGCNIESARKKMAEGLQAVFPNARIHVQTDIYGACLAVYNQTPVAAGILGTGSAAAGFHNGQIVRLTPSLGYVLADEGAGSHIGRQLLTAYLYKELPEELSAAFERLFPDTTATTAIETFYGPHASGGKLAEYTRLASEFPEHAFIQNLVKHSFSVFVKRHMEPLLHAGYKDAGIIGSVGYGFRNILQPLLLEAGFRTAQTIADPMDKLPEKVWGKE